MYHQEQYESRRNGRPGGQLDPCPWIFLPQQPHCVKDTAESLAPKFPSTGIVVVVVVVVVVVAVVKKDRLWMMEQELLKPFSRGKSSFMIGWGLWESRGIL